ncbi:BTAD domain-containing putative transcriptional regulator [Kitasatospora sp. NPDC053057]|uniref:AfsR/SARP family transcriptional regulator n=1 Tax=Kitasatospora sp. NPDC053057 TaxID=3364062 RepID=UPI0037C86258
MDIEVLGQFSIREHGRSMVPSAGKPRQVLALLALRAGRIVPVPTLMEEVWGHHIPRSAATTLQTYILQLRRKITAALPASAHRSAKEVLVTCFGGYQLAVRPDSCDLAEFERLAALGNTELDGGDPRVASVQLGRALALWRGPALVDVPIGRVLETEVLGMEETRMQVLEKRIEADLLLGRHQMLLGELRMLVAQHPMNENLCALLMTALYRSGSPWRALDAFRALRRTLIDELGVEPSGRLQRLHQAVLAGDPALEAREPAEPARLAS